MINKQNLWFITLFSLILVLSIYYVTMSDDALASLQASSTNNDATSIEVSKSNILVALEVQNEEAVLAEMDELQTILLDDTATLEEKNNAYDSLQALNSKKGKEDEIEAKIKEKHKLDSFVKIEGDQISVVIASGEHSNEIANNIIRTVQDFFETRMYITVKFQK